MTSKDVAQTSEATKSNWVYSLMILLIVEKIIQHVFITLAFYFDWNHIGSTVAVSPRLLMVLGAIVAGLFVLSLRGMIKKQFWAINLVIALALFDIVGEFVGQGGMCIVINVSFLVAALLLILVLMYRRQLHTVEG